MFRQTILAPGDRIEARGLLTAEVHPEGEAVLGRGVPMMYALADDAQEIQVRRLPPSS
jgi:hypothetical protein